MRTLPKARWGFCVLLLLSIASSSPAAIVLFQETFNGYTYFPDQDPQGDPVNKGVPLVSEGANENGWRAARFETGDSNPISADVAVQYIGGNGNNTPVGRAEDDAGLLFEVSTLGYQDVTVRFDWRFFSGGSTDQIVVGWTTLDLEPEFSGGRYADFVQLHGPMSGDTLPWWTNNWTEVLRVSGSAGGNNWHNAVTFPLPSNTQHVWVAFWIDNGEGDFIKIDNVVVTGDVLIPEPAGAGLLTAACVRFLARRRRR